MRGMFNDFAKDSISVLKTNGQRFDGLKASVQKGKVFLWDSSIFIEPKDLIIRHMSNGGTETLEVTEPGFHEAVMDFEAHYQMSVRRMGEAEAELVSHSTIYNFHGDNARVNNQSVDNSTNTVNSNSEISDLVAALRAQVETLDLEGPERLEALEVVDEIKSQLDSPAPKKTIVKRLIASLPKVESLTTIGASIMTMLGG
ncbi:MULTISPECIES: hypothetical protein [Pseudomonas]|nr:hypothetical protein [Pseudomonas sp. PvP100]MBP1085347.1 hypothetical protein [Pseudomonas sp. PvP007]MBP1193616.1 hypothetical protein [Pseudomonas sp. PvP100]